MKVRQITKTYQSDRAINGANNPGRKQTKIQIKNQDQVFPFFLLLHHHLLLLLIFYPSPDEANL